MVDLAVQAFNTNNFELSAEIYERHIKENGPNSEVYLGLADSYAKQGSLHKAFEAYLKASKLGKLTPKKLKHLVQALLDSMAEYEQTDEPSDPFSCGSCRTLWFEPVTAGCGHTFCRRCIHKKSSTKCKLCQSVIPPNMSSYVNILLSKLSEKWFPKEVEAARFKNHGNKLFEDEDYEGALEQYNKAFQNAPSDHTILSNRSFAYFKLLRYSDALTDADQCIVLKADWPKGHYRRGAALSGLRKHEEAALEYLRCLRLDPSLQSCRDALSKCLLKVLSPFDFDDIKVPPGGAAQHPLMQLLGQKHVQQRLQEFDRAGVLAASAHIDAAEARPALTLKRPLSVVEDERGLKRSSSVPCLSSPQPKINKVPSEHNLVEQFTFYHRHIDPKLLNKEDVECAICSRLLYEPVTTACGHMFCFSCVSRCVDHKPQCPLCKACLQEAYLIQRLKVTEAMNRILQIYFSEEYRVRKNQYLEELNVLHRYLSPERAEVPIFVCVMALPKLPCPLHIFEPRYRLMIRQCMESGTRQFGMCLERPEQPTYADLGVMLEIKQVMMLPDGRSKIDTVGGRRFKVIERSQRDGYNTALVEFLHDQPVTGEKLAVTERLHNSVLSDARAWFHSLPIRKQLEIRMAHGDFPALEQDAVTLPNGPAWHWWVIGSLPLGDQTKMDILGMDSLFKRLTALHRTLAYLRDN